MNIRSVAQGIAASVILIGCAGPQQQVGADELRRIRTIEVVVEVPQKNFVYAQGGTTVFVQPPPGASIGAAVGAAIFANLLIAGIEHAVTAAAREAAVPLGNSVKDLDLRGTAFRHLQAMTAGTQEAPALTLTLSAQGFPKPEPVPLPPEARFAPHTTFKPEPVDLIKPLIEHAKASPADATLYINLLPLFRAGDGQGTLMQSASALYDKSGRLLANWNTTFTGPAEPNLARAEALQWWADGRYRRFMAQGIRAVMRPIAENLTQPALTAQRDADMARAVTPMAEPQKQEPTQQRPAVARAQESTANAMRMRSTACAVESDDKRVTYRYERHARGTYVVVSAYCPGEQLSLWNQDLVPGMSWLSEPLSAPAVVTRVVKDDDAPTTPTSAATRRPAGR